MKNTRVEMIIQGQIWAVAVIIAVAVAGADPVKVQLTHMAECMGYYGEKEGVGHKKMVRG